MMGMSSAKTKKNQGISVTGKRDQQWEKGKYLACTMEGKRLK